MSETTSTPTPTETLRERVRGALATVPLGEDDVHVFYVAEKHLDRLTDAVLAAVSAAAPARPTTDEREATPDEAHDIGYTKGHTDGYREAMAALAARPAPVASGEVEWGVRCDGAEDDVIEAEDREDAERIKAHHDAGMDHGHTIVRRTVTAWTVADAPAADDEGGQA